MRLRGCIGQGVAAHHDSLLGIWCKDTMPGALTNERRYAEGHSITAVGARYPAGHRGVRVVMASRNSGRLCVAPDSAEHRATRRRDQCQHDSNDSCSKHAWPLQIRAQEQRQCPVLEARLKRWCICAARRVPQRQTREYSAACGKFLPSISETRSPGPPRFVESQSRPPNLASVGGAAL